jgi:hypothetical protein
MKLLETNWDAPQGATPVEVEYPDALIAEFVNWIRRSPAWKENPEIVERRLIVFNRKLAEHRNTVGQTSPGATVSGGSTSPAVPTGLLGRMADPAFRAEVERALKEYKMIHAKANRLAALERARAAKKARTQDAVPL